MVNKIWIKTTSSYSSDKHKQTSMGMGRYWWVLLIQYSWYWHVMHHTHIMYAYMKLNTVLAVPKGTSTEQCGTITMSNSQYCEYQYWYQFSSTADTRLSMFSAEQLLAVMIQFLLPFSYFYYLICKERSIHK